MKGEQLIPGKIPGRLHDDYRYYLDESSDLFIARIYDIAKSWCLYREPTPGEYEKIASFANYSAARKYISLMMVGR